MMTDARTRPAVGRLPVLVALLALTACAGSPPPGANDPPPGAEDAEETAAPDGAATREESYGIPPEHLPPPGQCRIWLPDEPAEEQARENPVGRCSTLRETIPAGGWLVYRPTDDSGVVRVWQYGEDGQVLHQRIYDVETGELLRHVGPVGN